LPSKLRQREPSSICSSIARAMASRERLPVHG
jgi:hypothetical protein